MIKLISNLGTLGTLGFLISLFSSHSIAAEMIEKPNIVILFSDDAGYADFGFQANSSEDIKNLTPNIDSIAKEGVHFTQAYMSASVCSPSRAGLMTGRYQQKFGYDNNLTNQENGLPLTETFGAKRMQELGYKTGLIGKWHLGAPENMQPNKRGFDYFFGFLQGGRGYFPSNRTRPGNIILENTTPMKEEGYLTDRFGDAACKFIIASKESPFFLFVSFTAPHTPNQPKPEDQKRIAHITDKTRASYAGLIVSLDDNVGKILNCLKQEDLTNNTLVFFTNDNGGQTRAGANNQPLSGKKGSLQEGGIRVPWAMRWPGKIPPKTTISDPIISLDIMPTLIDAAGGKIQSIWKFDGVSILNRIIGKEDNLAERPLYWRRNGKIGDRAILESNWKLYHARSKNTKPTLYNLNKDVAEQTDLSIEQPEIYKALLVKLDKWEATLMEPLWGGGHNGQPIERRGRQRGRDTPR